MTHVEATKKALRELETQIKKGKNHRGAAKSVGRRNRAIDTLVEVIESESKKEEKQLRNKKKRKILTKQIKSQGRERKNQQTGTETVVVDTDSEDDSHCSALG